MKNGAEVLKELKTLAKERKEDVTMSDSKSLQRRINRFGNGESGFRRPL